MKTKPRIIKPMFKKCQNCNKGYLIRNEMTCSDCGLKTCDKCKYITSDSLILCKKCRDTVYDYSDSYMSDDSY